MDYSSVDIFHIYSQYCAIASKVIANEGDSYSSDDLRFSREALSQLLKVVESRVTTRVSILGEVNKLMSKLELMADFSEFSRFYNFVFFICRENGQKNISVSMAVMAWRLVLSGRFRLLDDWCNFVEKNQRHNISEDTWRQVLSFSHCVHKNLEGYDPEGAWPVLIDDFVDYMYSIKRYHDAPALICNCADSESQLREDNMSVSQNCPISKRKLDDHSQTGQSDSSIVSSKRRNVYNGGKSMNRCLNLPGEDDSIEMLKHGSSPSCCIKSVCAIEGCLSRGFAGLLSGQSCMQVDPVRGGSYYT